MKLTTIGTADMVLYSIIGIPVTPCNNKNALTIHFKAEHRPNDNDDVIHTTANFIQKSTNHRNAETFRFEVTISIASYKVLSR